MSKAASPFKYTTVQSVQVRLGSKVQFQQGETPLQEEISNDLFLQLVHDAESDVEIALMSRYFVPFQGAGGAPFATLPDLTVRQIRKLVDYRATVLILSQDFGRGTNTDANDFKKDTEDLYDAGIQVVSGVEKAPQTDQKSRVKMNPPLPGLRLALTNKADKGTFGKVINTDASNRDSASYAIDQINDPSKTYLPGRPGGGLI